MYHIYKLECILKTCDYSGCLKSASSFLFQPNPVFYRTLMLIGAGLIAVFGSSEVGLSGAGPLGCLTTATVAAYKWRQRRQPGETVREVPIITLGFVNVF